MSAAQIFILLTLVGLAANGWAQVIQVPEDCLNRVSPCLIRNEGVNFQFKIQSSKFSLVGGSILKIEKDSRHEINLDLIDGFISFVVAEVDQSKMKIQGSALSKGRWMVARSPQKLELLNLTDYQLRTFRKSTSKSDLELVKSEFINKLDFLNFAKNFFYKTQDYKNFVRSEAPLWKSEFDRQNEIQSKVLMRTIASEKEQAKLEAERKAQEEAQAKKLKSEFFYRTFNR